MQQPDFVKQDQLLSLGYNNSTRTQHPLRLIQLQGSEINLHALTASYRPLIYPLHHIILPEPDKPTQLDVRNKPLMRPLVDRVDLHTDQFGQFVYGQEFLHTGLLLLALSLLLTLF